MKVLFFLILTVLSQNLWANTSTSGTRGGGNVEVAAFFDKAQGILNSLLQQNPLPAAGTKLDIAWLLNKLTSVKVEAVQIPLQIDGVAVDAINYPDQNLIQFNQDRWLKMSGSEQAQLVIHELLGVSAIADTNYKVSSAVVEYVGSTSGYDNRNLGGSEPCSQSREIFGEKAEHLVRALAIAKVQNLQLDTINCHLTSDNVVRADQTNVVCNPVGGDWATAQILTDALAFIGVWGEGSMSHVDYDAENISCTAVDANEAYKCSLKAYWNWACPL